MGFPPVPASIKSIAHVLKVADEHDARNIVVSYWARMYACQTAMRLIPGKKPPEVSTLLVALMDWLEQTKKANHDVEGITNETVAVSMIEDYAMKLFDYADTQDRAEKFDKNMIKAFYTSGILMDVLEQFGEQTEDMTNKRKYAKWKAAYIHNCLKTGDTPTSGGPDDHLKNVIDITKDSDDETQNDLVIPPRNQKDGFGGPAPSPVTPSQPSQPNFPPVTPTLPTFPPSSVNPTPQPAFSAVDPRPTFQPSSVSQTVNPEMIQQAQKYCKYATSALNYDDVKTAIENLSKALNLLTSAQQ